MPVNPVVFAFATGVGLFADKYILDAANFADALNSFESSEAMVDFNKAAPLWFAILGMVIFGPLSDVLGRRPCMLATLAMTSLGALGCALSPNEWWLIVFRSITGIGMGGEYPLASTHAAKNSKNKNDAARNVGLLYFCGNGIGKSCCSLFVWLMLSSCPDSRKVDGAPNQEWKDLTWRWMFGVAAIMAFLGLICRFFTTKSEEEHSPTEPNTTQRGELSKLKTFWMPLAAAGGAWFLYDFVEYGLGSNDAQLFGDTSKGSAEGAKNVFLTRITSGGPSILLASFCLQFLSTKLVQAIGFVGVAVTCLPLSLSYTSVHDNHGLFLTNYIVQYAFQQFDGVSTMAVAAAIFPGGFSGTGAGISAGVGKLGAAIGITALTQMKQEDHDAQIFTVVVVISFVGLLLTLVLTPRYGRANLDKMEQLALEGDERGAVKALYAGSKLSLLDAVKPVA